MSGRRESNGPALVEGVYEHLVTEQLARELAATPDLAQVVAGLDDADAHVALARHLGKEIDARSAPCRASSASPTPARSRPSCSITSPAS